MATAQELPTTRVSLRDDAPYCLHHPTFDLADADKVYSAEAILSNAPDAMSIPYLPDDATRDCARRMHYACYRSQIAKRSRDVERWKQRYFSLRDRVVLGNRKLVYRAVRKRMAYCNRADDMIGEGHIVLIRAVEAYNPWLGVRFSTYAFTCLMRAFSRITNRFAHDWLARAIMLDSCAERLEDDTVRDREPNPWVARLDEFFQKDHPLLSVREKTILSRRFCLTEAAQTQTLDQIGRDLSLSKERVRQVQASALDKLRQALAMG